MIEPSTSARWGVPMTAKARPGSFSLFAPAKVNFCLEVLGKRHDGYHEVRMLMAGIALCDRLDFEEAKELSLDSSGMPGLDCGPGNIVVRAARLLQKASGVSRGARIHLAKEIPLGAGLAGGSTDAAATLIGLNRLWDLGLGLPALSKLGASLGSDIPFCLESGWAIASGRGEKIKKLEQRKKFHLLLLNPGFEVSTKWAYQNVDSLPASRRNLSQSVFDALDEKDFEKANKLALNDLERVTAREYPQIGMMRQDLSEAGALLSRMSGSGPTVWGLFKDEAAALKAEKSLKYRHYFARAVSTIGKIPKAA